MKRSVPFTLLACLLAPSLATGQEAPQRFQAALHFGPPVLPTTAVVEPAAAAAPEQGAAKETAARDGRAFLATVLHTVGGALVGGWVGYVGSQVALSDWDEETNGAFSTERSAWVAGGMVAGILGSRLVGATSSPASPALEPRRAGSGRNVLTREEIESSGASNAYDLIHFMRKEWLISRGTQSFRETASGVALADGTIVVTDPGHPTVVVYMDDLRIGEIDRLRDLVVSDLMEIQFIEPQEAAYRYGSGHSHGVILLKTVR